MVGSPEDEARLQALVAVLCETAPDLVAMFRRCAQGAVLHADERVLIANDAAAALFGARTADEMRALRVEDLVPSATRDAHASKRVDFARAPSRRLMGMARPMCVVARDGRVIPVEIGLGPTTLAGEDAVIVTMRDLRERMRAEEALRQATRLDTVGRLAGGVAHDFNNLLTVIIALAEELEGKLREAPEALGLVREIGYAGGRAADLTRQLLAFARQQPNNPRTIDLNEVVRSFARLLGRTLGEGVTLRLDLAPGELKVTLDPVHVEQVLLNLAVNARDAMTSGGELTVRTATVEGEAADAAVVCLDVVDTGCGMSDEAIQHVFEPFFTTKAPGAGTGLGLATVYGIVRQGHGDISVTSRPGAGTTFHITFPASYARVETGSLLPPARHLGDETVLVVEDDATVRQVMARILDSAGYAVLLAASLAEALAVTRDVDALHLLVTDVVMPDNDGVRVAEALRRQRPSLPVVFVSGYAQSVDALSALGRLIAKPFTTDTFLSAVRDALDVG